MTDAPSPGRRGWAVLLALALPAVVLEFVLFVLALGYSTWSCSEVASRLVMISALAIPPVVYFFIDRRETRGRAVAVVRRTVFLAVMVLLPIAVAAPGVMNAPLESQRKETKRRIEQVAKEVEAFAANRNTYPVAHDIAGLRTALGKEVSERDAWCRALRFDSDGKHYSIVSYGKDGQAGGGDAYHRYDEDLVFRDGFFEPLKY